MFKRFVEYASGKALNNYPGQEDGDYSFPNLILKYCMYT
jgi:hypothetical protein